MNIDTSLQPSDLSPAVETVFALAGGKIRDLDASWDAARGAPVFTVAGEYTTRGWTEWTQGFQYGAALLTYDATGDAGLLELGRAGMRRVMPAHLTHVGVHDHGFNTMSTYGNLLRLAREGRWQASAGDLEHLQLAIRVSGAVQAARWTPLPGDLGYICSFNGPQSLFIDTIRSLRVLAAAHELGQVLMGERDRRISLLRRLLQHLETTLRYNVFFGAGRDHYDAPGRVVHEALFNVNDGSYRCPSTQQGYSPFSTWTRGLAWAILGCAEMLEYLAEVPPEAIEEAAVPGLASHAEAVQRVGAAAAATAELLPRQQRRRRHPLLGHRRSRPGRPGRLARRRRGPVQRPRAGGQFRRRHRRPGPAAPGHAARRRPSARRRPLPARWPHGSPHPVRGALPGHRPGPPGPAAAHHLPSPQRLGPHPARPPDPVRRVMPMGRLPRPGAGPADPPPRRRHHPPLAGGLTHPSVLLSRIIRSSEPPIDRSSLVEYAICVFHYTDVTDRDSCGTGSSSRVEVPRSRVCFMELRSCIHERAWLNDLEPSRSSDSFGRLAI